MSKKHELTPEQYETIKKTYGHFFERLVAKDWLGAFLVAYGLLENRIQSMYRSEREFRRLQGLEQHVNSGKHRPFSKQVNYLEQHKRLHAEEAEDIRKCGDKRNQIMHDLVWARNEADYQLCMDTLDLERKAKNARKRQKYWHAKSNNKTA